jgi:type IX secretion system PorP/SprF family membrane protein
MFSTLSYNPAYSGIINTEFTLIHRSQWLGYNPTNNTGGAPSSQYLGLASPIKLLHGGVGLVVLNDKIGNLRNTYAKFSYGYHVKIKEETKLSIGLSGGMYSFSANSNYIFNDQNDPNINTNGFQQIKPDIAFGIWYQNPKYFLGFSANHINSPKFLKNDVSYSTAALHYYLTGGYIYNLSEQIKIKPSIVIKTDQYPKNMSFDLNTNIDFFSKYWVGFSYRKQEALVGLIGISFLSNNSLKLGYAFDYVTNGRGAKALTSHELMLSYVIPPSLSVNKPILRTPRYRYN